MSKRNSPTMTVTRALLAVTCGAVVAAFVPSHVHVLRPAAAGRVSCPASSPLSPEAKRGAECLSSKVAVGHKIAATAAAAAASASAAADATASFTSDGTTKNGVARASAPVVLVGADRAMLETFAEHLLTADSSPGTAISGSIIDLGEIARSEGASGVELALAGSKVDGVLVCPCMLCVDDPDVQRMVRAHPLTVHLAISAETAAARESCEQATKYTVVVGDEKEEEDDAKTDLSRLVAFARKPKSSPSDVALDMGKNTFFLSLTFEDFTPHRDLLPDLTEGVDAMELRVDLLANKEDPYTVLRQLSILRRHTGYLPVVFTIRSKGQCGAFPDDPEKLFRLARWGLRAGCEVMDVEANWPISYREGLIREAGESYPGAVLVGSYHVVGKKTSEEQAKNLFMECYHDGTVDAVKVCVYAWECGWLIGVVLLGL